MYVLAERTKASKRSLGNAGDIKKSREQARKTRIGRRAVREVKSGRGRNINGNLLKRAGTMYNLQILHTSSI
jgi:hypothetical protein